MPMAKFRPVGLVTPDDIPANEVPPELWTAAENMAFRELFAERVPGWRYIYDANAAIAAPLHLLPITNLGINWWLYGCGSSIGVTDSAGVHTDLTPAAGAPSGATADEYTSCELNGKPIINWRDATGPHSWDLDVLNNVAPLTDWPSGYTCDVIRSHRNYLIALNIGGGVEWPSVALWSDAAAPGNLPDDGAGTTWTPAAGNDAGSLSFGDTGEGIVDGLTLQDKFIVYKPHSTYIMEYVGGSLIFGQRPFLTSAGALASNCVTEWKGKHVVLTDGDVILHDGNQAISLVDKATRRSLFNGLDQENYENCYVIHNNSQNEIWVCYPEAGAQFATRALVWDTNTGKIQEKDVINVSGGVSFRDVRLGGSGCPHAAHGNVSENITGNRYVDRGGDTYASVGDERYNEKEIQAATDGLVGVDVDAEDLVFLDNGEGYAAGDLQARVTRETLDLGDASAIKLVNRLWPRITGAIGTVVQCRVGAQMQLKEPINWSPFREFTIGESEYIDTFATGRFISVEFQTTNGGVWRCAGFDLELQITGNH